MTTKVHLLADSGPRPLVLATTPGQRGDGPMFEPLMAALRLARSVGRPRTRPDRVLGDKAYSSRANRAHLRRRGIKATIAHRADGTVLDLTGMRWARVDADRRHAPIGGGAWPSDVVSTDEKVGPTAVTSTVGAVGGVWSTADSVIRARRCPSAEG
ncbi:transposase [Nocardiopsis sp. RV163]|uniref:transposase n=1 Tax=Nocardiopsis sp. RV163 TaxID=1661388 RepID=UPI002E1670BC